MPPTVFTDQSGPTPGTALDASHLNGLVVADLTEAATNDTLGGSSTWVNNLNRIRYILGQIQGAAWNAATAMIPLSQKGAANGVATLSAATKVPIAQLPLNGSPSSPPAVVAVDSTGVPDISVSAGSPTASAGINGAVPSQVLGYTTVWVTHNGTRQQVKIPYFGL